MRPGKGILLNQIKYSLELISKVELSGAKPFLTPLEANHKRTTVDSDVHVENKGDPELEDVDINHWICGEVRGCYPNLEIQETTHNRSSAEAEHKSMAVEVAKLTWVYKLLKELNCHVSTHVTLYCDNQAAIQIASNPIFHERTKHIDIECHFVREKIKSGLIQP
ncbi:uncharacterized protein LOC129869855 [Solanum dulcamara]|uniref:uncharacterized protein LOC129869855 n=1 Tax=Solanum dulcamara TaxID=45834 RepID=UPI0024869945|nr:uncharacterized protein LOC129869855 [Solanum dulcamara]